MGRDKHAPQAECGSGSSRPGAQAQGRETVPSLLSSLLWAAGRREPLQVAQGATAILGARWETPHSPLEPASPSKAESPQATGGGMRWRLLPELKHNPQVSGDEAEHIPASGRRGRRGSPPYTGHFSGKVKRKPLQPQGRAGSPPERKGLQEHRVDQARCWGGKGNDAEKRPQPCAWSPGCTRTGSPHAHHKPITSNK